MSAKKKTQKKHRPRQWKAWIIQWDDGWCYREALDGLPKTYRTKKDARAESAVSWVFARPIRVTITVQP